MVIPDINSIAVKYAICSYGQYTPCTENRHPGPVSKLYMEINGHTGCGIEDWTPECSFPDGSVFGCHLLFKKNSGGNAKKNFMKWIQKNCEK